MGKKGKRKKKAQEKNRGRTTPNPVLLQELHNFGRSKDQDYTAEKDKEFLAYVERLKERLGNSQENRYYTQACGLAEQALQLASRGMLAQGANLLSNAWLTHYRATQDMCMHFIFASKTSMTDYFDLLQRMIANEPNHSVTKFTLSFMLMNMVPNQPPEDLIQCLDAALQLVQSPGNPNVKTDTASVLIQKSACCMKLGRRSYALKCLKKASKVARGECEGNSALYMSLCLRQVGIHLPTNVAELNDDIRSLRYLREQVHVENRDYCDICIRLSNLLMCCGDGAPRDEAVALQKQSDESLLQLQQLHGPHDEQTHSEARAVSTAMMVGGLSDDGAFKPVNFVVPPSVAHGTWDGDGQKPGKVSHSHGPEDMCMSCGATGQQLLKCSRCKTVQYCNATCQRDHWQKHKVSCKKLKAQRDRGFAKVPKVSPGQNIDPPYRAKKTVDDILAKADDDASIVTQYKWIKKTLVDPNFVQWFVGLNVDQRKKYVTCFMPDMALCWRDEEHGLLPGLAVDYLCGDQCECVVSGGVQGAISNHGAPSGLLCQMWQKTKRPYKETFEQDLVCAGMLSAAGKFHVGPKDETVLVQRTDGEEDKFLFLTEPGKLSDEMNVLVNDPRCLDIVGGGVFTAAKSRRKMYHSVFLGVIDMYHEHHIQESTPNLMIRSQGCTVCGKELPLYYIGGVNLVCPFSDIGVESRCYVCKGAHWCSDECRLQETPSHSLKCRGEEVIINALRSMMPDKQPVE